ncbi:hypothetical protein C2E23DRAFT_599372 [Lenzites betulinus]|nr:hypothetical protein C2E23DRAFT_599372 [Lenzites betulinus]
MPSGEGDSDEVARGEVNAARKDGNVALKDANVARKDLVTSLQNERAAPLGQPPEHITAEAPTCTGRDADATLHPRYRNERVCVFPQAILLRIFLATIPSDDDHDSFVQAGLDCLSQYAEGARPRLQGLVWSRLRSPLCRHRSPAHGADQHARAHTPRRPRRVCSGSQQVNQAYPHGGVCRGSTVCASH